MNTNAVVSDVHRDVAITYTAVSEIHRVIVQNQEGTDGKKKPVGIVCTLFITEPMLTIP